MSHTSSRMAGWNRTRRPWTALLTRLGMAEPNLFFSRVDLTERAYDVQAARIAYVDEDAAGNALEPYS